MSKSGLRNYLIGGAAAGAIAAAIAAPAWAQEATYDFNQPSMEMAAAIQAVGHQTGANILVDSRLVTGLRSPALRGALSTDQALIALLDGTGLIAQRTDKNSILIRRASDPQSGSAAGDGAEGTVQALIVTAQKREEDIQDVPIAISAFTQEDLTRSQVAGGPDLMTQVPNFTFTKTNFSSYSIQIRGIGTQAISATVDPAVAVAFNNTSFIRNRFFEQEFYDLQRVEVLRGPQGTLYGRNATAGVVNIISAKPNLHNFEVKVSADVSNYSSTRLEGMANLPIVDDKVGFRLAGAWTKRNGYVTNQITGNPIDGRDLWSARATLRFEPTDWLRANLIYEHFQEDDDRLRSGKQLCNRDFVEQIGGVPTGYYYETQTFLSQGCKPASLYAPESFEAPNGWSLPYFNPLGLAGLPIHEMDPYLSTSQSPDLRIIESTVDPHYKARSDIGELQIELDISPNLTLTSETGYSRDSVFSTEDYNRFNTAPGVFDESGDSNKTANILNNGVFCDPQLGCSDRLIAVDLSTGRSRQFSQEFRLSSDFDGPMNFSLGGNFLKQDSVDKYYVFANTLTLFAAMGWGGIGERIPPGLMPSYEVGVSDNSQCLRPGLLPGAFDSGPTFLGCIYLDPNPIGNLNDLGHNYFLSNNPYKLISYAAFGEIYYQVTPSLKVTGGLRWTVDKKSAPLIPSWLLVVHSVGYPVREVVRQEWREPTGRLAIDWKPDLSFTDETLLYASYSHGYKAGGANPPPAVIAGYTEERAGIQDFIAAPKTFRPEFVNAYEVGAKNTLLEGKLTLNTSAFYYDYSDYQISQIINRSAVNYNFDAKVWGVELEADWSLMENLRLGLKVGYENTRVGGGSQAIDIMDRTAGHPGWVVMRPFPTVPSNCIMPDYVLNYSGSVYVPLVANGGMGPCITAYLLHKDPVTRLPYIPNPPSGIYDTTGYPGFDPLAGTPGDPYTSQNTYNGVDYGPAPNNGEGFFKDLSGNELPNAPHYTATIKADYTLPLPHDWLVTLHTDLYYQSEAWTRIFNMPGYDKLKAYKNINIAAIFSNEDAGWQVMAYVKNVLDKDNITGAFLNSDDTGLTTNVFLNEPRLYGLRVTKSWSGQPWWTGSSHRAGEPWPLTVELGGLVERDDAPNAPLAPQLEAAFPAFDPLSHQAQDLDWGDGREVRVTYRPEGAWSLSARARFGRSNHDAAPLERGYMPAQCAVQNTPLEAQCALQPGLVKHQDNYVRSFIHEREDHTAADFLIGKDVGLGGLETSHLDLGLGYAKLQSTTDMRTSGRPEIVFDDPDHPLLKYETFDSYKAVIDAKREFQGAGPVFDWEAAQRLFGGAGNHVDLAWSVGGGVLFGKQEADIDGSVDQSHFRLKYLAAYVPFTPEYVLTTPVDYHRSKSVTVPLLDLSAGLSWQVDRFKVGAGYRWERYYNAIDGGYDEHRSYDRTIDGPYFKVAVGFGG